MTSNGLPSDWMSPGFEVRHLGQRHVVLRGEVDAHTCREVAVVLDTLAATPGDIHIDVSSLHLLAAAGVSVLVTTNAALGSDGRVILHGPTGPVLRVLEIVGLDRAFVSDRSGPAPIRQT